MDFGYELTEIPLSSELDSQGGLGDFENEVTQNTPLPQELELLMQDLCQRLVFGG